MDLYTLRVLNVHIIVSKKKKGILMIKIDRKERFYYSSSYD